MDPEAISIGPGEQESLNETYYWKKV